MTRWCSFRIRTREDDRLGIPFRPKNTEAREVLKEFKDNFDDAGFSVYENSVRIAVTFNPDAQVLAWRGELLHQLALRAYQRGETRQAKRHFELSLGAFDREDALGRARVLRDYGLFLAQTEDIDAGIARVEEALRLHEHDVRNAKGLRQLRITQSYLWRIQLMKQRDQETIDHLIAFALGCEDCHVREQQIAIEAALPYAQEPQRAQLLLRRVEVFARRRKLRNLATSTARLAIDINVVLMTKALRSLFRRE